MSPDDITTELRLAPDKTALRGSKRQGSSPVPLHHRWSLFSGLPDTRRLDDHVAALLDRLKPSFEALRALTAAGQAQAGVSIVRYFEPGPEDPEILAERDANLPEGIEVLRGQHPLLGFHLEERQVTMLGSLGLSIDFDEYGDEHV